MPSNSKIICKICGSFHFTAIEFLKNNQRFKICEHQRKSVAKNSASNQQSPQNFLPIHRPHIFVAPVVLPIQK